MTSRIRGARKDRGWSQTRLIGEMERVAKRRGVALPGRETLKSRVSRWENGHSRPDDFYRQLLREAFGLDDRELGLDPTSGESFIVAAHELQLHLTATRQVDGTLFGALRDQTNAVRIQDRQYGAALLLEQMRGHVLNLERHLVHSVFDGARRPMAQLLSDAAALTGWQALDVLAVEQAWRFFETATAAARQAEDTTAYAFARLEQAHVLTELRQASSAADVAESVWADLSGQVPLAVRCWMAAATAELCAADGRRDAALSFIARAEADRGRLSDEERPPYLVFDDIHLERWIGRSLVLLGDPSAEARLRVASGQMDQSFTRASASLSLDLAAAVQQRGALHEADALLASGEILAQKVGSRRQLRRARELRASAP